MYMYSSCMSNRSIYFRISDDVVRLVGIGKPDEKDITNGRIIVFHYAEKNLQIVHEKSVKAFVTSLLIFKDKLLVTCGSSVKLMRWTEDGSDLVLEQSVNR